MEALLKQILQVLKQEGKTGKYNVCRTDDAGADKYYGFFSPEGYWYIMKETSTGEFLYYNEDKKQLTVAELITQFGAAWTARASNSYEEFPIVQLY